MSEGGSSNRPPLFEGADYYYWKGKMELFLQSQDNHMWTIVENGNYIPYDENLNEKKKEDWSEEEGKRMLLNFKAKLFLTMALSREEYDRVQECKNTKEIWDTLKIHHEGTSHVKETRIDIGVRKFELFEMKETENIDEMYGRFTIIMNELRSLEKDFTVHERVRKILRCLPKSWRHIVTAITEAKDLKKLRLEDLIGSLKAHEVLLQEDKSSNKSKMIAFKTNQESQDQEQEMNFDNQQQEPDEEDHQDQIILLTRKLQRMIQRRDQNKRNFPTRKENAKTEFDKSQVTCYGCYKLGHYKSECPLHKRKSNNFQSNQKSFLTTWDEPEEPTNEDEQADLCLMAKSDNEEVNPDPCSSCEKTEYLFDNLFYNSQILEQTCERLRNENLELRKEKEILEKENKNLIENIQNSQSKRVSESKNDSQKENIILKENVLQLKNDISNFVKSTETFQKIMGSQVSVFDKVCIGFKTNQKQKLYENFFIPEKITKTCERYKCTYCEKYGHLEPFCFKKRKKQALQKPKITHKSKCIKFCKKETPKNNTNHQGPKKIWVPKVLLTSIAGMSHNNQEIALVLGQWMLKTYDWR